MTKVAGTRRSLLDARDTNHTGRSHGHPPLLDERAAQPTNHHEQWNARKRERAPGRTVPLSAGLGRLACPAKKGMPANAGRKYAMRDPRSITRTTESRPARAHSWQSIAAAPRRRLSGSGFPGRAWGPKNSWPRGPCSARPWVCPVRNTRKRGANSLRGPTMQRRGR